MSTNNLSIVQQPVNPAHKVPVITNWNPLIGIMVFKDQNINSLFFYKLGIEVYKGSSTSGTLIAKYKQRRNGFSSDVFNGKARAFFDVRDVVNTQLVDTIYDQNLSGLPFSTLHKLGANDYDGDQKIFSKNGDASAGFTQLAEFFLRVFESYATSTSSAVTEFFPSTPVTNSEFYIQATLPLFTPRSVGATIDSTYIQGRAFNIYKLNNNTSKFMSDVKLKTDIYGSGYYNNVSWDGTDGDYHTLGFLNGETDFDSKPHKLVVTYFNGASQLTSTEIPNQKTEGGSKPETTGTETNTDEERLIYFGCGPGNLNSYTAPSSVTTHQPSNVANNGWTHYKVKAINSSSADMSDEYIFVNKNKSCKGFKMRRLAWRNSLGCYDYLNFELKSTQTIDITRNTFEKPIGIYNKSKYRYSDWDTGKQVRESSAVLKETLNTDYMTDDEVVLVEKLLMSTRVYIVENVDTEFTQAVTITDSSFIRKNVINDRLVQYSVQIEYANPLNTNS
mgnify:FL=1